MPQVRKPRARRRVVEAKPEVFAEKKTKKPKVINTVEFTHGGKTYIAKFSNPPKVGKVKFPEAKGPKEANTEFIKMAEDYGVEIYAKGKEKPLEKPGKILKAKAGKAALKDSMKYSIDVKKLVPIPKMKQ